MQKLVHDLRSMLNPTYHEILKISFEILNRPLAAPTLKVLLSMLSALFKYLLVPSTNLSLLEASWEGLFGVLPKCNGEVQRATAEVWGSTLRRLKSPARERAVILMMQSMTGIEETCAWILISSCKVNTHFP